jgi:TatD DNase family protein
MNAHYPIVDGHAHLDQLEDLDRELTEAKNCGVTAIIGVGMSVKSNQKILAIAEGHPGYVFPAIGYHPWEVRKSEIEKNLAFIEQNINLSIAIGEVGLDYKVKVKRDYQKKAFSEILTLSTRYNKPLILHCRGSHRRVLSMISDSGITRAVFHWYTAPLDLLKEIVDAGYYISATPALTHSPPHRHAVREAPVERILVETDCPVTHHGRSSRPSDVLITLREVAKLKGLPVEDVAERTSQNAMTLFGLPSFAGKPS